MSLTPAEVMALVAQLETDGGLLHQMVHGGSAATVETAGGTVPSMAKFFADKGVLIAAGFSATSTSEVMIGTGAKAFTVPAGKLFAPGQLLLVVDAADAGNWMLGTVTTYADTTLTIAVTETSGAGTISSWIIALCGTRGPQGVKGDTGDTGPKGDTGDTGASAYAVAVAAGFVGDEAAWLASLKGEKGDTGATGEKGDTGDTGPQGDTGDTGASAYAIAVGAGFVGDEAAWLASLKGDTGETGATGAAGTSFTVDATGLFSARATYDAEAAGFSFLATDTGDLYIRETAVAGVWSGAIAFGKGEKGDTGDTGAKGDTGDVGASAYQVAVGAGFVGDEAAWLASLKGEKGDTGATGEKGDTGDTGPQGDTGDTGASAYAIAVGAGFVGDEAAWLASLKGEKGDTGDQGPQGEAGPAGAGDVLGPSANADLEIVIFDGVDSKAVKGSGVFMSDLAPKIDPSFTGVAQFEGVKETVVAMAAADMDLAAGTVFTKTAAAALTLTLSNIVAGSQFTLRLTNGGAYTVTWPSFFRWPGGTAPTLTAAGTDVISGISDDGVHFDVAALKDSK